MANVIKDFPTTSMGDPEILPWATSGTSLEPTTGQESTGWQPQAVAGPPDYRLENYARLKQSELNARGVQTALFVECCQSQITLAGFNAGVNQRRITINAINFDVTDGGSLADVRDAFVAAINSDAAISALVTASAGGAGILYVTDNAPGDMFSTTPLLAVSVLAGAGTITVTSPGTTPIVREDAIGMASDLVIGAKQADHDAVASHNRRIVWRKSRASLRAGYFSATQADDANTGNYSIGLGRDVEAQGADAAAIGSLAVANATSSFAAAGANIPAGATFAVALGAGAGMAATGTNGVAIGPNATVTQDSGVAIGNTAASDGANAIAIGSNTTATGADSFAAIGGNATADKSIAIGYGGVVGGASGGFASGYAAGTLQATGTGSRVHGASLTTATLEATGAGAVAMGYANSINNFGNIQATGDGSFALGHNQVATNTGVALVASGHNAVAIGSGNLASGDFSMAVGYGAKAANRGEQAQAAKVFDDGALFPATQQGSAQKGSFHVLLRTTDATANQALTPGAGAVSFAPLADTVYLCSAMVVAKEEAVDNSYASWKFDFTLAWVAGALAIQYATPGAAIGHLQNGGAGGAAWDLKINVSGNNVVFQATGAVGKNIRWSARCDYVAVGQHT